MQFSFSTVFMAFLSSNLVIIFTAVCFRHRDLLVSFGYRMFALLLGLTLVRFLLPFQFPFTANIVLPEALSLAIALFRHPFLTAGSVNVSLWTVFEAVWLAGALVKLAIFTANQLVFNHHVVWKSINVTGDEHYARLLDEICGDSPNPFCVFELPGLKVPMLYGIRLPRILIPAGMELQEEDLRYLLSHETAHHFHHDIMIKLGVSLLHIVYWWNPACRTLKEQLGAVLEMRIDSHVTGDAFESKCGYLKCLISVAESGEAGESGHLRIPENTIALYRPERYNTLTNRFELMSGKPKPYARFLHVSALVLTLGIYLFSYAFIFEARYVTPEESVATIDSSGPDVYAVLNEDYTYNVYFRGCFVHTVNTLENYDRNISVYSSLSEVPEELRINTGQ